jgi:hypothetical protein
MSPQQMGEVRRSKRPPAIPDDVADPAVVKATGRVNLPIRVRWSAPARSYDLADRRQRARVYEQVPVEGVGQDVREIIDVDELVALWDDYCPTTSAEPGRTGSLSGGVSSCRADPASAAVARDRQSTARRGGVGAGYWCR